MTAASAMIVASPAVLTLPVVVEALELVMVLRLEFVAVFVSRLYANLFIAELAEQSVSYSRVKPAFEVRCETRERLVAKLAPAAEVLHAIAARILRDFGLIFVTRIVALQLVNLVEFGFRVPFAGRLKKGFFSKILAIVVPASLTWTEAF